VAVDLEHERYLAEAILMRASSHDVTMRRAIGLLTVAILLRPAMVGAQAFFPDDPLEREPAPLPAADPAPRNLSVLLETVSATFGRPGERHPGPGVIKAQGINTLGEVLDGPWYVNRHGRTRMSLDDLRRGSGDALPPATGAWRVVLLKNQGARPSILFRDANNQVYLLRFDPPGAPELATGADMVSSRIFHALGYHVPEAYLVAFTRDRLVVEANASDITSIGGLRDLRPEDIDNLLARVERQPDGSYRAVALRVPTEMGALIGPFQFFGTRSDDPNDIVPHEHRRDLRGLYVFSAWLNHTRMDPLHTMDMVVAPPDSPPHVRHYLFDFMATLGSGITGPKSAWEGRDPVYAQGSAVRNMAGLGVYSADWMRAKYPDFPAVGRFESATFEPDKWTTLYEIAPFDNRLPDDTFWAAKQVMAFTDEEIRAIVQVARYSDPAAERWIVDSLIERRHRIGRTYFARVLPLDDFAIVGNELRFTDLAVKYGFAAARSIRVDWSGFDNQAGKPTMRVGAEGVAVPAEVTSLPPGSYAVARLAEEGARTVVNVYLRSGSGGLRVMGIDREWPGRTLVDPRIVPKPVRNRYAELEPERQKLFATYAQALNARTGEHLSTEERFRALTSSEQTTFDGITHALMHTQLTDENGQPLATALDLLTGLERIAGQQTGRGGDQQFRLYVTLRPDAREVLERSREFVRGHENTVYHAGYPHSYRMGDSVPGAQFSLAEDGLSADIDVDYRASKTPQALFNGHLTSSNSDVRAGDNADRHGRKWNGFVDWWSGLFGPVGFAEKPKDTAGPFGTVPASRPPVALPPNRSDASIPELADAVQEFLTDWVVRRNFREAQAFLAPDVLKCVADSADMDPKTSPERLRQVSLQLLEKSANSWGRPRNLTEAMNPVLPWSSSVKVVAHAFDKDFTIVEAPTELGALYECGATPPKRFAPSNTPQYGTYYGVLFEVLHEGQPGGAMVFVWRRVSGEWRLVAYRAIE
jgi:hypothetical protein